MLNLQEIDDKGHLNVASNVKRPVLQMGRSMQELEFSEEEFKEWKRDES